MAESMLMEKVEVYSDKYDFMGVVLDYGVVKKLKFYYEGRKIEMAVERNVLTGESLADVGREMIESYVENLIAIDEARKLQLHYWHISKREADVGTFLQGHGIVTGHKRLSDSQDINTSEVKEIRIDEEAEELLLITRNSEYHCPLVYCNFARQDAYPDIIPGYDRLKAKYNDKKVYPSIEPGKVLLVLANFSYYYFHSVYYIPEDAEEQKPLQFAGSPHVGMFQDSFLISVKGTQIDLRYFPHYRNVEFYVELTDGKPFFIENVGDVTLYAKTHAGTIRLEPGERKEVTEENAESFAPRLPRGDLYPAGIIE